MNGRAWTEKDVNYVVWNWGYITVQTMAKRLGRSETAVLAKVKKLQKNGARFGQPYITQRALAEQTGYTRKQLREAAEATGAVKRGGAKKSWRMTEKQANQLVAYLGEQSGAHLDDSLNTTGRIAHEYSVSQDAVRRLAQRRGYATKKVGGRYVFTHEDAAAMREHYAAVRSKPRECRSCGAPQVRSRGVCNACHRRFFKDRKVLIEYARYHGLPPEDVDTWLEQRLQNHLEKEKQHGDPC